MDAQNGLAMRRFQHMGRLVHIYSLGSLGGVIAASIGLPLPWMIGPLLVTAGLYLTGLADIVIPVKTRPAGQIVIASQVGVYFSPAAFAMMLTLAPLLVGIALATAVCAFAVALLLARAARLNLTAAFLASLPTSPVEAAIMAERFQCNPGPVILAQTVRIAAVVVLVPVVIYAIDGWPAAAGLRVSAVFDPAGTTILLGVGGRVRSCFVCCGSQIPFSSVHSPPPRRLQPGALAHSSTLPSSCRQRRSYWVSGWDLPFAEICFSGCRPAGSVIHHCDTCSSGDDLGRRCRSCTHPGARLGADGSQRSPWRGHRNGIDGEVPGPGRGAHNGFSSNPHLHFYSEYSLDYRFDSSL